MSDNRYEAICEQAKLMRRGIGTEKNIDKAKEMYEEAIQLEPSNGMAISGLGVCYEVEGNYAKAKELYEKAADLGFMDAVAYLGTLYLDGMGVEKDERRGLELLQKAADLGSGYGAYMMSWVYSRGSCGVEPSKEKDFEYSLRAANANNPGGYCSLGRCYEHGIGCVQDLDKAEEMYIRAMNNYDNEAPMRLAEMYQNQSYGKIDFEKAKQCMERAFELGNKTAPFNLAAAYFNGDLGEKDMTESENWMVKAANVGNNDAITALVKQYYYGTNYPQNLLKSEEWAYRGAENDNYDGIVFLYEMLEDQTESFYDAHKSFTLKQFAAERGNVESIYDLGRAYLNGIGIDSDKTKGLQLLQEAANNNYGPAFYSLGVAYANGDDVEEDMNRAFDYFKCGADKGHLPACNLLYKQAINGVFSNRDDRDDLILTYINKAVELGGVDATIDLAFFKIGGNRLIEQNVDEGIKLLEEAAAIDQVEAIRALAGVYITEEYGKKDIKKSIEYYERAAALNDSGALVKLGDIYKDGDEQGVEQDLNKAAQYYRMAYEAGDVTGATNLGDMWIHGVITVGEGMDLLEWAANKGSALAMAKLANMLENGIGKVDIPRAIELYNMAKEDEGINADYINEKLAKLYKSLGDVDSINALSDLAEQGNTVAQFELADFYMNMFHEDYSRKEYEEKAIELYRKAAESGHITSQILLGTIFLPFSEHPQDIQDAIRYLETGLRRGEPNSTYVYLQMMAGEFNRNYQGDKNRAMNLLSALSDENNVNIQHLLGSIYDGCGPDGYEEYIDKREAINQYTRAANNGHLGAMCDLAISYITGDGVVPDYSTGKWWFEKASELGSARAKYSLGVHLASGKNEPKNIPLAKHYLEQAANIDPQSEDSRYIGLSYLHLGAIAIDDERDYNLARTYINLAINSETLEEDSVEQAKEMLNRISS